ncbi:hypothetical protein [Streptomyces sp. YU58]|uniref:hypothetical protein n=1 Tax=Streptomyces sp. SX92 TaxID=3158972 RepID=UPI0027B881E8|nr:hypothetical protein [Streptomyces coralus]WLW50329.1 hypothetical protein QU709_02705 [Streptomyces coralus]
MDRRRDVTPADQDRARRSRQVVQERAERLPSASGHSETFQVVEHEQESVPAQGLGEQPGGLHVLDARAQRAGRDLAGGRYVPCQGLFEVGEQASRLCVGRVDRQPRHRMGQVRRSLADGDGLAGARRRQYEHHLPPFDERAEGMLDPRPRDQMLGHVRGRDLVLDQAYGVRGRRSGVVHVT